MKPRPSKSNSIFGLAFMDCICCGFGAVILLLVMNKGMKQGAIEEAARVSESILREVQDELVEIRGETAIRNLSLDALRQQVSQEKDKLARLRELEFETKAQYAASKDLSEIVAEKKRALFEAKQLRDSLRNTPPAWRTDVVGGIPADSEYVIFVVDTSGSMRGIYNTVAAKLHETLSVYPRVKGFQVLNADGRYLYPSSAGTWLAADGQSRADIVRTFVNWRDSSSSSPVGGVLEALRAYGGRGQEISIFVFGDDFHGQVDQLVQQVEGYNPVLPNGSRAVRIHGVGFPAALSGPRAGGGLFAIAMRALAERNGGAFVTVPR